MFTQIHKQKNIYIYVTTVQKERRGTWTGLSSLSLPVMAGVTMTIIFYTWCADPECFPFSAASHVVLSAMHHFIQRVFFVVVFFLFFMMHFCYLPSKKEGLTVLFNCLFFKWMCSNQYYSHSTNNGTVPRGGKQHKWGWQWVSARRFISEHLETWP